MGYLVLTTTSPPQTFDEPLDLLQIKEYLGVPVLSSSDAQQDAMLEALITGAREMAEGFQNQDLTGKQWDLWLDCFESVEIQLKQPLSTVDLIQYKDSDGDTTSLTADTEYMVDTIKGTTQPAYGESWPSFTAWPSSAVLVRHTTLPARVHENVTIGMRLLVSDWYYNRLPRTVARNDLPEGMQVLLSYGGLPRIR